MAYSMELDLSITFAKRKAKKSIVENEHWSIRNAKDVLLKRLESFIMKWKTCCAMTLKVEMKKMEILVINPSSNNNTHKKLHGFKVVKQQDVIVRTKFAINAQMKATIKMIIKIMKKTTILKDQSCMMFFTMLEDLL